jgi:hypothetical protein
MTPKEKAEELVNNYFHIIDNCHPLTDIMISAKQCALIAVYELILDAYNNYYYNYWQEVKQEIEKL